MDRTRILSALALPLAFSASQVLAQSEDMYAVYATGAGACDAGPESRVEISEGRVSGPGFSCDLGEMDPVGSGMVNYDASCIVDDAAFSEPVTFDLGNYSDHFELALPGRDDWLALYPCTPVEGLEPVSADK